jgi:hypothetical protein
MIDKGLQKVLTLFYFFVKKYKNIAWAPCGQTPHSALRAPLIPEKAAFQLCISSALYNFRS